MKKIIPITFICVLLLTIADGRTITKKEARQLLEKVWSCLKTSDTASFINMWLLDNIPYHQRLYTKEDVIGDFNYLKDFLDTALSQNLQMDNIKIDKDLITAPDEFFGTYNIKAWFRYKEHYYKGFGLYVIYKNEKWLVRFQPDTSTMLKY
jgi:hypothetical protein